MPNSVSQFLARNKVLSSKLGSSYLESSCLRKLIRPITLPGKLYATYFLVDSLRRRPRCKNSIEEYKIEHVAIIRRNLWLLNTKHALTCLSSGYYSTKDNNINIEI